MLKHFVFGSNGCALLDHISDDLTKRAKVKEDATNVARVEREAAEAAERAKNDEAARITGEQIAERAFAALDAKAGARVGQ